MPFPVKSFIPQKDTGVFNRTSMNHILLYTIRLEIPQSDLVAEAHLLFLENTELILILVFFIFVAVLILFFALLLPFFQVVGKPVATVCSLCVL